MRNAASTLSLIWRLAVPYFRSEDRWAGRGLLAAVVAIELTLVWLNVLINQWNNRFYNALQERNWGQFVAELQWFSLLATAAIVLAVYQLYLNQWLQIRWRRWMTQAYLGNWLDHANHYRMQLLGDAADNPDQRISEDIRLFVTNGLTLGIGLLSAVVTLASFVAILWSLSAAAPLHLFGAPFDVPGYLVWAALLYAVVGTAMTHWIGSPLINLNFMQQRYEADFRFNLMRVRENSEQIALLRGETSEQSRLLDRFGRVVTNWTEIMTRQKRLTFLTSGYAQAAIIFPFVVTAPAYFANAVQLGSVMQTASAFDQVQKSLSYFITAYRDIAEWLAVVERLAGFNRSVEAAQNAATSQAIDLRRGDERRISIQELALRLPNGVPLLNAHDITIETGERVLVSGPSGAGKSSLFRAIAGIWPFGSGQITLPANTRVMTLPQRPYFPLARLGGAVAYPAPAGEISDAQVADAITAVGLPALASRIDEEEHWSRVLSLGEQQRLGIARALLHAPDVLFLDEATASLDEPSEQALYALLHERLRHTTIVSIGHRAALKSLHGKLIMFERDGETFAAREASPA